MSSDKYVADGQGSREHSRHLSTYGRYVVQDELDIVYVDTLHAAIRAERQRRDASVTDQHTQYNNCWQAWRGQRRWGDSLWVRPATEVEVRWAECSVTYEVELYHHALSHHAAEEVFLQLGAWVKRIHFMEKLSRPNRPAR